MIQKVKICDVCGKEQKISGTINESENSVGAVFHRYNCFYAIQHYKEYAITHLHLCSECEKKLLTHILHCEDDKYWFEPVEK